MLPTHDTVIVRKKGYAIYPLCANTPSFPSDQPSGEKVSSQCRANHDQRAFSQFHGTVILDTSVGRVEEGHQAKTEIGPGSGCRPKFSISTGYK
jgi:hypothetical protein